MNGNNTTYDVQSDYNYLYYDGPSLRQPLHMVVIYSVVYALIFIFGLVGNTLVVIVVCKNPAMHNVTNYFLANLAISDLVVIVCIPIALLANLFKGK